MAGNIHSIGEFNNRAPRNPAPPQQPAARSAPLLGYGSQLGTPDEARKESFWDMIKFIFCPFFTSRSFIFAITVRVPQVVDVLMYIASVAYDYDSSSFLTPTNLSLDDFGAQDGYKMQQKYQIWRFLTPCLLHANLLHIVFNMIMQMVLGFRLEPTVGFKHTVAVYVLAGIGGNVLSADCSPNSLAVGASGAIFGINSAMVRDSQIAWIIMNWHALEGDPYRIMSLIWLIMILVFNLLFGFVRTSQSSTLVDNYAHLGGILVGFASGIGVFKFMAQPTKSDMYWKYAAWAFLGLYFILTFVLFYTSVQTTEQYY